MKIIVLLLVCATAAAQPTDDQIDQLWADSPDAVRAMVVRLWEIEQNDLEIDPPEYLAVYHGGALSLRPVAPAEARLGPLSWELQFPEQRVEPFIIPRPEQRYKLGDILQWSGFAFVTGVAVGIAGTAILITSFQ